MSDRLDLVLAVPLVRALEMTLLDADDPAEGVAMPVSGLAGNGSGGLHAAALAALAELAGYLALVPALGPEEHAVTHATSTSLVSAAPDGATVEARGTLDRRGRRTAFVTVTTTCRGATVARTQLVKSVVALPR